VISRAPSRPARRRIRQFSLFEAPMPTYCKVRRALDTFVLGVCLPLTVVMLVCVVWQVISRYFFGISTSFTDEVARYTFIWISLLGASYVLGQRGHIAITAFVSLLPYAIHRKVEYLTSALIVVFSVSIMCMGGWSLVDKAMRLGQVTPAMQIPMWIVYAVVPISGVLFAIYAVIGGIELALAKTYAESKTVSLD